MPARELPPFTRAEFGARAERVRRLMTRARLDAVLVSTEANLGYLSGFASQLPWLTPARPWYFLLPRVGEPVGIIPDSGVDAWRATSWVVALHTWRSPNPENEGLDLIAAAIGSLKRRYGRIGFELGPETRLGFPVADLLRLKDMIRPAEMADGSGVLREARMIKSPAEIARIRRAARIACDAFDALPTAFEAGWSERDAMRWMQAETLHRGADKAPFMMVRSGRGAISSLYLGPTGRRPRRGDVMLIDAGCVYDGYSCDFDRLFSFGPPSDEVKRAHDALWQATEAGIGAARPGNTAEDVFLAQAGALEEAGFGRPKMGRFGHGLGRIITEPPSNKLGDRTKLRPGMVLTIEPGVSLGPERLLVHEENLAITEDGNRLLTRRARRRMAVIEA